VVGAEPADELRGQRAGTAADVERALRRRDAGSVRERLDNADRKITIELDKENAA